MKKRIVKLLSLVMTAVLVVSVFASSAFTTSALSSSEWKKKVDSLKKQQASDKQVLGALQSKMNALTSEILAYNKKIQGINSSISANNAQIKKDQEKIAADKKEFQKRIRSIYMSGSDSSVRILLGSESFSQFLQLSQLTSSVSSHDKKLIEDLKKLIDELNKKNEENKKLVSEQESLKAKVQAQQKELQKDVDSANNLLKKTNASLSSAEASYKAAKAAEDAAIQRSAGSGSAKTPAFTNNSGAFLWPVAGFYNISAGYKSNDSVHKGNHNGIDISGGGISGAPIRAVSDGYVSLVKTGCSHNSPGNCHCNGGYGNYCVINHGTTSVYGAAAEYSAYYAHAVSIIVSAGQQVKRGQVIGYVGCTGWSTGYHLHFGLLKNGGWVNPQSISYVR